MVGVFTWGDDIEKGAEDLRVGKKLCHKKVTVGINLA